MILFDLCLYIYTCVAVTMQINVAHRSRYTRSLLVSSDLETKNITSILYFHGRENRTSVCRGIQECIRSLLYALKYQ